LIAAETVKGFGQDDVERVPQRLAHECRGRCGQSPRRP
jgi:hypothetical protein